MRENKVVTPRIPSEGWVELLCNVVGAHRKHPPASHRQLAEYMVLSNVASRTLGDTCSSWWTLWQRGGRTGCIPVPQIVIFSTPAPEGIRKAIDFPKLFYSQATHSTKKLCVGKPEGKTAVMLEDLELNFLMILSVFLHCRDGTWRLTQPGKRTEHHSKLPTGLQQLYCAVSDSTEFTQRVWSCATMATFSVRSLHTGHHHSNISLPIPSHTTNPLSTSTARLLWTLSTVNKMVTLGLMPAHC